MEAKETQGNDADLKLRRCESSHDLSHQDVDIIAGKHFALTYSRR